MSFEQSLSFSFDSNDPAFQLPFELHESWSDSSTNEMQANYQLPSYTGINDNNVMMMEVDTSMVKLENVPNRNVAAKVPLLGPSGKPKRIRTNYTSEQLTSLESHFATRAYLTRGRRIQISKELNLQERQVKIWFQNRRMKNKRENLKAKMPQETQANNNSDGESRPSSTSSAASNTVSQRSSSPNDNQIRKNLMKYCGYTSRFEIKQETPNRESLVQVIYPQNGMNPTIGNEEQTFTTQQWQPIQIQVKEEQPVVNQTTQQIQNQVEFTSDVVPVQLTSNAQHFYIDESFQLETPDFQILDSLLQNDQTLNDNNNSTNNNNQQVSNDNFNNFNTFTVNDTDRYFFENVLNCQPTSGIMNDIADDWAFKSNLIEL